MARNALAKLEGHNDVTGGWKNGARQGRLSGWIQKMRRIKQ